MVELARVVTNIHQRHDQVKATLRVEEVADKLGPAVALGLGATGETVTRQVHEMHVVGLKEVDVARLARRTGNLDQVLAAKELVHNRRLAHVGAADKAHLGAGGLGNLRNLAVAGDELGKLVVNGIGHGHSLVVGSYKRARYCAAAMRRTISSVMLLATRAYSNRSNSRSQIASYASSQLSLIARNTRQSTPFLVAT